MCDSGVRGLLQLVVGGRRIAGRRECATQNCCSQFTTCANSPDCAAIFSCFNTCIQASGGKGPGACETSCEGDASASGSTTFNAGVTCVQTHCESGDGGGD